MQRSMAGRRAESESPCKTQPSLCGGRAEGVYKTQGVRTPGDQGPLYQHNQGSHESVEFEAAGAGHAELCARSSVCISWLPV